MGSLWIIDKVAEQLIQDAIRKGEFDNLEGRGKPLRLEDDSMVHPDLRMAYKLLKNSGHAPPEIYEEKDIRTVMDLLENCEDEQERYRQMQKLNYMVMKLNTKRNRPINMEKDQVYFEKTVQKISVAKKKTTNPRGA